MRTNKKKRALKVFRKQPKNDPHSKKAEKPDTKDSMGDRQKSEHHKKLMMSARPCLKFSPSAWAKLLYFRDHGSTEVGGFGVTLADDLLYIEEFVTVKQEVTEASIAFNDEAVADHFERQVDGGRKPEQFARIWLHTHPGESPHPSGVDEETFSRVFGSCEWALMFIVAQGGTSYARLRFNVGPGGEAVIPVTVDYTRSFESSDHDAWKAEYEVNIIQEKHPHGGFFGDNGIGFQNSERDKYSFPEDWKEEFEAMDPHERRFILNELSAESDPWEEDFQEDEPWY